MCCWISGPAGSLDTVFADQTWIGFAGSRLPARVAEVWETVRGARDAAIAAVREAVGGHRPIAGFEADRAARGVSRGGRLSATPSCTGRATRSTATCTARARTWTTTRPTMTGCCCREWVSRWNRGSICRASSECGAR